MVHKCVHTTTLWTEEGGEGNIAKKRRRETRNERNKTRREGRGHRDKKNSERDTKLERKGKKCNVKSRERRNYLDKEMPVIKCR